MDVCKINVYNVDIDNVNNLFGSVLKILLVF